jgi:hypothetical protein
MTMIRTAALLASLSLPAAAHAQPTGFVPCEENSPASLNNLWVGENGEGIRTFYEGSVTLLRIDTIEPAAASSGVIVMMWIGQDLSDIERLCWVNSGHGLVDIDGTQSSYHPAEGLTLTIPTSRTNHDNGDRIDEAIRFRLNVGAGTLTPLD